MKAKNNITRLRNALRQAEAKGYEQAVTDLYHEIDAASSEMHHGKMGFVRAIDLNTVELLCLAAGMDIRQKPKHAHLK